MSFDVHPLCVLKGEKETINYHFRKEKELLEEMRIDYLLVIHLLRKWQH